MREFLCKIGLHGRWYWSSWLFGGVNRCGYCGAPDDAKAARHIEEMERAYLAQAKESS